jgi:hypothetical protein
MPADRPESPGLPAERGEFGGSTSLRFVPEAITEVHDPRARPAAAYAVGGETAQFSTSNPGTAAKSL